MPELGVLTHDAGQSMGVPTVSRLAGWELRLFKSAIAIGVLAIEQRSGRFQSTSVQADMKALFDDLVASDTELGHDARAA